MKKKTAILGAILLVIFIAGAFWLLVIMAPETNEAFVAAKLLYPGDYLSDDNVQVISFGGNLSEQYLTVDNVALE